MSYRIIHIYPKNVPEIWGDIKGWLEKAIPHGRGEILLEDIYRLILCGKEQLWITVDDKYALYGVVVTEIIDYPRKRIIRVVALGGREFRDWLPTLDQKGIEWAKQIGATAIDMIGRPGWKRMLKGRFEEVGHFIKEL